MIVTENQAKQMLCIGPRGCGVQVMTNAASMPRYPEFEQWERRCAGSRCMAWKKIDMDLGRCSFIEEQKNA